MSVVEKTISVRSDRAFGRRPPPGPTGELLRNLEGTARHAVLMAFRGRSAIPGRRPRWLDAALDIRFTGITGEDTTDFHFEAPPFGEAVSELYDQEEFWSERPAPGATALDLLAPVVREINSRNEESDYFDAPLLRRVAAFKRAVDAGFDEISLPDGLFPSSASISRDTVDAAEALRIETPPSRQVRIAGSLDMLRASTQTLALRLDDGEEVRGVLSDSVQPLTEHIERRIVLFGSAIYRPSGKLLRVDVDSWEPGDNEPSFFSRIPPPMSSVKRPAFHVSPQGPRRGVAAFFGTWPGNESDEELLAALRAIS